MKPPKLPGAEKFKFWKFTSDSDSNHDCGLIDCADNGHDNHIIITSTLPRTTCSLLSRTKLIRHYSSSSSSSSDDDDHHHSHLHSQPRSLFSLQSDCGRRKVVLPITSRLTAKVLALTDLPLDSFLIKDYNRCSRLREKSIAAKLIVANSCDTENDCNNCNNNNNNNHRVISVPVSVSSSNASLDSQSSNDYHDTVDSELSSLSIISTTSSSSS